MRKFYFCNVSPLRDKTESRVSPVPMRKFYFRNVTTGRTSNTQLPRHGNLNYAVGLDMLSPYRLLMNFAEVQVLNRWSQRDTIEAYTNDELPAVMYRREIMEGQLVLRGPLHF